MCFTKVYFSKVLCEDSLQTGRGCKLEEEEWGRMYFSKVYFHMCIFTKCIFQMCIFQGVFFKCAFFPKCIFPSVMWRQTGRGCKLEEEEEWGPDRLSNKLHSTKLLLLLLLNTLQNYILYSYFLWCSIHSCDSVSFCHKLDSSICHRPLTYFCGIEQQPAFFRHSCCFCFWFCCCCCSVHKSAAAQTLQ